MLATMGVSQYTRWEVVFLVASWVVFVAAIGRTAMVVTQALEPPYLVLLAFEIVAIAVASRFRLSVAKNRSVPMMGMAVSLLVLSVVANWPIAGAALYAMGLFIGYTMELKSVLRAGYAATVAGIAAFVFLVTLQALVGVGWWPPAAIPVAAVAYMFTILFIEAARQRWRWTVDGSVGFTALEPWKLAEVWALITGASMVLWAVGEIVTTARVFAPGSIVGALVMIAGGIAFLSVAPRRRLREATERLDTTVEAARALPWSDAPDVEAHLLELAHDAVRAETVELSRREARDSEIAAPIINADGHRKLLIATRPLNALAFSSNDRRVLEALAHMGSMVMQNRADISQLERRAGLDSLTGLPNHRAFQEHLRDANDVRNRGALAVLYLDLDDFKDLNDRHGHLFGDRILTTLASRIQSAVRPSDVVSRVGGDEFAIILTPLESSDEARAIAEAILAESAASIAVDGMTVRPRLSIGIAYSAQREVDVMHLVDEADRTMLSVKHAAKEDTTPRGHGNLGIVTKRSSRINDIVASAIDLQNYRLSYQPVVSLVADQIWAFEALLRVSDENDVAISPDMFVEKAKQLGRFNEFTKQIVRRALVDGHRFAEIEQTAGCIAVNIDAAQVMPAELGTFLEEIVEEYPDVLLCLELNERSVWSVSDELRRQIERLRSVGIMVALDDYGSDSSTVASLVRIPMDILKIDRTLANTLTDPAQVAVLRALQGFGDTLEYSMVVEGVENAVAADALRQIGVRSAQGFYYGVPMSADATAERLRRHQTLAVLERDELSELVSLQQFEAPITP